MQQNYKCLSRVPLRLRGLLKSWQDTNHQVLIKSQQNWFKQGVEQLAVWSLHLFILFGIRRNCLRSGRSWSQYLSIRRAIKQIVEIIKTFTFVNYVQNFIQHSSVKFNSLRRGNYWGSSVGISTQQVNYWSYILHSSNTWEKKREYNEAMHQLCIDFTKTYYSVMREVLCNFCYQTT
jgi:hypothetical protein